jgi:adenine phosphoribosyltransferase
MDLKQFVRDVPDFPIPGILFRDITPLLADPDAVAFALDRMALGVEAMKPDVVAAIESRGFLFGMPIATRLRLPFVPIRKPGKLPAARMSMEYALEYSQGQLDIHSDALGQGQRVVVVDDLLATGGTAQAACRLVEMLGAKVCGLQFLIELIGLNGRDLLRDYILDSVVAYD